MSFIDTRTRAPRERRLSNDDVRRLGRAGALARGGRTTLSDGASRDAPASPDGHALVVERLIERLVNACQGRAVVSVQNPVVLAERSRPRPDFALLLPRDDFYARRIARAADVLLLIEVAGTTLDYDRDAKLPLYARHGIPETWLVDVAARRLTMHAEACGGRYRCVETVLDLGEVRTPQLEGLRLDLSGLF